MIRALNNKNDDKKLDKDALKEVLINKYNELVKKGSNIDKVKEEFEKLPEDLQKELINMIRKQKGGNTRFIKSRHKRKMFKRKTKRQFNKF